MKRLQTKAETIVTRHFDTIDPLNIGSSFAAGGYTGLKKALAMGPEAVLGELKTAGLRGRSRDTGYTHEQWSTCRFMPNSGKTFLCSALDTEPGNAVNAFLLSRNPHAVLEGMLIGAFTVGAAKGYLLLNKENTMGMAMLEAALAAMSVEGVLNRKVMDSDFKFEI